MVGILYHDDYLNHITQIDHPERPGRVTVIVNELKKDTYKDHLVWEQPRLAEVEEIEYVHSETYIKRVKETAKSSPQYLDSPDTLVSAGSYQAALRAAGAVMTAIDGVLAGRFRRAFCPVRPPGHHARYSQAMGFCLFNNIAIGARHLQEKHNIHKILIVDFDVHHCNGTEEMLSGDNDILLCSIHQYPHYPGTGLHSRLYAHSGGVLNAPVPPGAGEENFMRVIKGQLADYVNMFMPEFVLISAGFDAHKDDPLGDLQLESDSYYRITREVIKFANAYCEGRVVSTFEGGYNFRAIAESAGQHVQALIED
ncbi:MAG: histone deacetylase family protein [Candidatus Latescibacterota bacterium]